MTNEHALGCLLADLYRRIAQLQAENAQLQAEAVELREQLATQHDD